MGIRKSRGYSWEDAVVEIFRNKKFNARRFGGPHEVDVLAHKDDVALIVSVECKSTVGNSCKVPGAQIQRCIDWCNDWSLYDNKMVILALKFGCKKTGKQREQRQFFKIWNMHLKPVDIVCRYDGFCKMKTGGDLWLEEFKI